MATDVFQAFERLSWGVGALLRKELMSAPSDLPSCLRKDRKAIIATNIGAELQAGCLVCDHPVSSQLGLNSMRGLVARIEKRGVSPETQAQKLL